MPAASPFGAVLTGGRSERMGRDKALVEVDGVPMAARVAGALHAGGVPFVTCVGGDEQALRDLGLDWTADDHPGEGPLGGLLTVLDRMDGGGWDAVVVSACDHPWLDGEAVADLLVGLTAAPIAQPAPDAEGRTPLLFAATLAELTPVVRDLWAAGERSFRWLGARVPVATVSTIDPARLRDVDTPADLAHRPRPRPS